MQLSSRQKITISSVIALIVLGIGGWYFFSSHQDDSDDVQEVAPVVPESADDIRIKNINLIAQSIKQAIARGSEIPLPEDNVRVNFEQTVLVYQGKAGQALFDALGLNDLADPVTRERYDFALSENKKEYEIVAYLDDVQRSNTHLEKTVFYSAGSEKDLFVRDFAGSILHRNRVGVDSIDMASSEMRKKAGLPTLKSCKDIYTFKSTIAAPKSGAYVIDIDGRDTKVFCDMQTDGGGWTLFYANNGYEDSPIAKSYVDMRDTMKTDPILDLSQYDNKYLAGLLDYSYFTQNGASDILIRNRTGDVKKWVKFTFSTSRALEWALGPLVLGKTEYGCISLPRRDTWSISNQNGIFLYKNLRQLMNHVGTGWGVSHQKYPCNDYLKSADPFLGFTNAVDNLYFSRTRTNYGVGGIWGGLNEFRYFTR